MAKGRERRRPYYRGRVVKKMSRTEGGLIKLLLQGVRPGYPGQKELVTQQQWDQHGEYRADPPEKTGR